MSTRESRRQRPVREGRFAVGLIRLFLALTSLAAAAPAQIAIDRIALHQFEDGPVLPPAHEFLPGETVFFSCRLTGYQVQKNGEESSVKLAWQMRVTDPAGVLLEKEAAGRAEDRILPEDKNWKPKFLHSFVVPPYATGGVYHVVVKVKDEAGNTELNTDLEFHVRGHDLETSPTLVARNFRFLRSEDDAVALEPPVYHPGDVLWARFDITGFRFDANNRFSVEYGLAVLRGTGEQLFSQPVAATESNESFYPQRYVPGALSLSLDKNVASGSYILVVTVRDKIGDQTWESREAFRVE
jgi:hypothetical protein